MKNKLIEILGEDNVFENESMSKHTSFKIGGKADFLVSFLLPIEMFTYFCYNFSKRVFVFLSSDTSSFFIVFQKSHKLCSRSISLMGSSLLSFHLPEETAHCHHCCKYTIQKHWQNMGCSKLEIPGE